MKEDCRSFGIDLCRSCHNNWSKKLICYILKYKYELALKNTKDIMTMYLNCVKYDNQLYMLQYKTTPYFEWAIKYFYPQHIKTINTIKLLQ